MRKYTLYAIGEIALVVIGILIALQINNWNESRKNKARLTVFLNQMINDLQEDIDHFQGVTEQKISSIYYQHRDSTISYDTLSHYMLNYFAFYQTNTSYIEMKDGGEISLIKDENLKLKIINYYEKNFIKLKSWEKYHKDLANDHVQVAMFEIEELIIELSESRYNKLIKTLDQHVLTWRIASHLSKLSMEMANEIILLIEKELKSYY
jgi:hypothetical protein